jgi:hypothetical protein
MCVLRGVGCQVKEAVRSDVAFLKERGEPLPVTCPLVLSAHNLPSPPPSLLWCACAYGWPASPAVDQVTACPRLNRARVVLRRGGGGGEGAGQG